MTLFLANAIVPVVLDGTGNLLLVASIVPIEAVILWIWWRILLKLKISLQRIFFLSLIANTISSIIGFLIVAIIADPSIGLAILIIPFLIITIIIESSFIWKNCQSFEMNKKISKGQVFGSVTFANIISYGLLIFFLIPMSLNTESLSQVKGRTLTHNSHSLQAIAITLQKEYYQKHGKFAEDGRLLASQDLYFGRGNRFEIYEYNDEGKLIPTRYDINDLESISKNSFYSRFIELEMFVKPNQVVFLTKSRRHSDYLPINGVIFVNSKKKFIGGICYSPNLIPISKLSPNLQQQLQQFKQFQANDIQLKNDKIICTKNSSNADRESIQLEVVK